MPKITFYFSALQQPNRFILCDYEGGVFFGGIVGKSLFRKAKYTWPRFHAE
jgi:hypothetical protein